MPVSLDFIGSSSTRPSQSSHNRFSEGYDSSSSTDSNDTATLSSNAAHTASSYRTRTSYEPPAGLNDFPFSLSGRSSRSSTSANTPIQSRSASPHPQFQRSSSSSTNASWTSTSDTDSEPASPLLGRPNRNLLFVDSRHGWWAGRRRARPRPKAFLRTAKRWIRRIVRHPLFPRQPITIVCVVLSDSLIQDSWPC